MCYGASVQYKYYKQLYNRCAVLLCSVVEPVLGCGESGMEEVLIHRLYAVAQMVEALRYKPEYRGFDSRWLYNAVFNL